MPTFCRHNRLVQNCAICSREQAVEMRPLVSSGPSATPVTGRAAKRSADGTRAPSSSKRAAGASSGAPGRGGMRVRRLARGTEDGYANPLVPGLHSSEDARRLSEEIAFSAWRLQALESKPWDLYAEVADRNGDPEERTWLAFQIASLGPVAGDDPWRVVREARTSWASGEDPSVTREHLGRRAVSSPERVFGAYRAWVARAGSQAAAYAGEETWTPERRFARLYERLALPGLERGPRYELLVILGALGVYGLRAGALQLGRSDDVSVAAKRVFGIGDQLLLERRALELASACELPLASLDLALFSWGCGERPDYGLAENDGQEVLEELSSQALGVGSRTD